jgi:hypothetical protein
MKEEEKRPLLFGTPEERVARILVANGRAPDLINEFSDDEKAELAAMITPDGQLLPGTVTEADGAEVEVSPREAFRLFMVRHHEAKKATDATDDRPPVADAVVEG